MSEGPEMDSQRLDVRLVRGVGSNGSPADDIALKAAAEALASFTTSDNAVCSGCDGSGRVVDGDDRLVRCPECGE